MGWEGAGCLWGVLRKDPGSWWACFSGGPSYTTGEGQCTFSLGQLSVDKKAL